MTPQEFFKKVQNKIHYAIHGHTAAELIVERADAEKDLINNEKRCKFLPGYVLPENIYCSTDFEEVIKDADFI